ncbi:MAG TPA: hypothetical protein VN240_09590 [Propylenella sp.]|nr:hypothetical protein [Propylenella sp.]
MTRIFKMLGLSLAAAFATAAVAANAASAMNFTAAKYPTTLTGSQTSSHVFQIGSLKVTCATEKTTGVLTASSETVSLSPAYEGCESSGLKAEVQPNGCSYLIYAPPAESEEGSLDIACPKGKSMLITALTCTIIVNAQVTPKHVYVWNTDEDIDIGETLTSVSVSVVKDTFLCPLEASFATMEVSGSRTLQGSSAIDVG